MKKGTELEEMIKAQEVRRQRDLRGAVASFGNAIRRCVHREPDRAMFLASALVALVNEEDVLAR